MNFLKVACASWQQINIRINIKPTLIEFNILICEDMITDNYDKYEQGYFFIGNGPTNLNNI